MFSQIGEIAPKALIIGGLCWAGANWAFLGPELGSRTLRANGHLQVCERGFSQSVMAAAKEEASKIPQPTADPEKEMAAQAMRDMMRSPLGNLMNMATQHTGLSVDTAIGAYEQQKRLARQAYERAVQAAKDRTTARLIHAADFCECVAAEAVSQAQNEFALYSGTLTIFKPNRIKDLNVLMARAQSRGACNHLKG